MKCQSLNQKTDPVMKAWLRFFVCLTTDDINEFYHALGMHKPRGKDNYFWDMVNGGYIEKRYKHQQYLRRKERRCKT